MAFRLFLWVASSTGGWHKCNPRFCASSVASSIPKFRSPARMRGSVGWSAFAVLVKNFSSWVANCCLLGGE